MTIDAEDIAVTAVPDLTQAEEDAKASRHVSSSWGYVLEWRFLGTILGLSMGLGACCEAFLVPSSTVTQINEELGKAKARVRTASIRRLTLFRADTYLRQLSNRLCCCQ